MNENTLRLSIDDLVPLFLNEGNNALLVLRSEMLLPAGGRDAPFFPATYAAPNADDQNWEQYNIDQLPNGKKVCLVDSVPSQANRMESRFKRDAYAELVPRVYVVVETRQQSVEVDLLDVGHRAADALVRFSSAADTLHQAFQAIQVRGDYLPLARIAPTSILFGCWDSRQTGVKLQRIVGAEIRAFGIGQLHRSSVYRPPIDYVAAGVFDADIRTKHSKKYAEEGFAHVPASRAPGGVVLMEDGYIRRQTWINLVALRAVQAGNSADTQKLQRYLLGLALTVFTAPMDHMLREGCTLVLDPETPPRTEIVYGNGQRQIIEIDHQRALAFAQQAAADFGVPREPMRFVFDVQKARETVYESQQGGKKKGAKGKQSKADSASAKDQTDKETP